MTITGANFQTASGVAFNGTLATTFTVVSTTSITATVPAGATSGPISVISPFGTGTSAASFTVIQLNNCSVTVNVPALLSGQTYWVTFTSHSVGTLTAGWIISPAQSVELDMYGGNPFAGLADPINKGPQGGIIASQKSSTLTNLNINAGSRAAGSYTVGFFNGSNSMLKTSGTISYVNTSAFPCPATPSSLNTWP